MTMLYRCWGARYGVALLATVLILVSACTSSSDDELSPKQYLSGTVLIGALTDIPGWGLYSNGVWSGFDIKLGNWLGEEIGFHPEYVPVTIDERMTKLQKTTDVEKNNENTPVVKLVIANFSISDKRREKIDFAGPYFIDSQGVLVKNDSAINKFEDIKNKSVCTTYGSTTQNRLLGMGIHPRSENTLQKCGELLQNETVEAISSDRAMLESLAAKNPNNRLAAKNPNSLRLVPDRVGSERYGIGLPNNRKKLCEFLTEKIAKFINEEWDQKFKDTLPDLTVENQKPNSGALDPCEASQLALPRAFARPIDLHLTQRYYVTRRARRGRRKNVTGA